MGGARGAISMVACSSAAPGKHKVRKGCTSRMQSLAVLAIDIADLHEAVHTAWATARLRCRRSSRCRTVVETMSRASRDGQTLGAPQARSASTKARATVRAVAGGDAYTVFRVGELGLATARAQQIADCCAGDRSHFNLWGERWSAHREHYDNRPVGACWPRSQPAVELQPARRVQIRRRESIRIGNALGYKLETIRGLLAEKWVAAARVMRGAC